jgi:hypothetical protein
MLQGYASKSKAAGLPLKGELGGIPLEMARKCSSGRTGVPGVAAGLEIATFAIGPTALPCDPGKSILPSQARGAEQPESRQAEI